MRAMAEIKSRPSISRPAAPRPAPLSISDSAVRRISTIVAQEGRPGLRFRIGVSGGGCSGFRYDFKLDDAQEPDDIVIERDGVSVVVDGMSLMYVLGSELDFVDDLSGAYFKVANPNASSSCGCGASFAI